MASSFSAIILLLSLSTIFATTHVAARALPNYGMPDTPVYPPSFAPIAEAPLAPSPYTSLAPSPYSSYYGSAAPEFPLGPTVSSPSPLSYQPTPESPVYPSPPSFYYPPPAGGSPFEPIASPAPSYPAYYGSEFPQPPVTEGPVPVVEVPAPSPFESGAPTYD